MSHVLERMYCYDFFYIAIANHLEQFWSNWENLPVFNENNSGPFFAIDILSCNFSSKECDFRNVDNGTSFMSAIWQCKLNSQFVYIPLMETENNHEHLQKIQENMNNIFMDIRNCYTKIVKVDNSTGLSFIDINDNIEAHNLKIISLKYNFYNELCKYIYGAMCNPNIMYNSVVECEKKIMTMYHKPTLKCRKRGYDQIEEIEGIDDSDENVWKWYCTE